MNLTTVHNKPKGPKPFAWSYSKLKNYEACPKRHWHVDIAKDAVEDESEALVWGNRVHSALARRVGKGDPLPLGMEKFEPWCTKVIGTPQGNIFVEQKLAIKSDFTKCSWFGDEAWYRGVADVIKVAGRVALVVDWKTGK